jgi:carboxyl-terminal processing protease
MVLDLRGNGGGDLGVTHRCLGLFLPNGTFVGTLRDRKGSTEKLKVSGSNNLPYQGRVFLMIDEESGSAAELFAAAMQETARAVLLGRRTAGALLIGHDHKLPGAFRGTGETNSGYKVCS